jgi:hypothetical protein
VRTRAGAGAAARRALLLVKSSRRRGCPKSACTARVAAVEAHVREVLCNGETAHAALAAGIPRGDCAAAMVEDGRGRASGSDSTSERPARARRSILFARRSSARASRRGCRIMAAGGAVRAANFENLMLMGLGPMDTVALLVLTDNVPSRHGFKRATKVVQILHKKIIQWKSSNRLINVLHRPDSIFPVNAKRQTHLCYGKDLEKCCSTQ